MEHHYSSVEEKVVDGLLRCMDAEPGYWWTSTLFKIGKRSMAKHILPPLEYTLSQ